MGTSGNRDSAAARSASLGSSTLDLSTSRSPTSGSPTSGSPASSPSDSGTTQDAAALFYDLLGQRVRDPGFVFMNYGYAEEYGTPAERSSPYSWLLPGDRPRRHHLALVRHVLRDLDLSGRSVLEVGSGRGGNASYLVCYAEPRRVLGVDRCLANTFLSRGFHSHEDLRFQPGDAQALPLADASFDVVLNLESSHCYPDFAAFLSEVHRVLRPGGILCWSDLWALEHFPHDWPSRERILRAAPFAVEWEEDITEAVAAAEEASETVQTLLEEGVPNPDHPFIRRIAEVTGEVYQALRSGRASYLCWRLRKA
ncbi:MAG: methyltransferase domain-containing protein [Acidobacteriota bacterium]|nr:methyltransferase domain-containing protein [Acidobacteriota bacterium]